MADAYLRMEYTLHLTDKDMRLVCLALAGKLKSQEDKLAAHELNLKIIKLQQLRISEKLTMLDGAYKRAVEENVPEVKE